MSLLGITLVLSSKIGSACVVGASIICIDLVVQRFPGKEDFRIQDSNDFLASSLSLSFGIMLFSSLNNMLPEAQDYLSKGGMSESTSAWTTIGCFLAGVIGIQFFSRILHHYIPSHIVDCDHTHDDDRLEEHDHVLDKDEVINGHSSKAKDLNSEHTPLLSRSEPHLERMPDFQPRGASESRVPALDRMETSRRPSFQPRLPSRVTTFMLGAKASCNVGDPCYGYSDPCGQECLKLASRSPTRIFGRLSNGVMSQQPNILRTATTPRIRPSLLQTQTLDEEALGGHLQQQSTLKGRSLSGASGSSSIPAFRGRESIHHQSLEERVEEGLLNGRAEHRSRAESESSESQSSTAHEASHHHHVPSNAFLAIGLQTSIAIALHKLPEGFITYATNHANPKLGFSVFMALFIHNITEGFAMALPLYLAINKRFQAMLWSSLLGGVSQPLGAGVAALWFKIAGSGQKTPGDTVYGCMFAITAGIMASVALQLFSESQTLTHNRGLCTTFAFIGMGILGISHALTAR